ncbi:PRA1 family protein B3-like [Rutidosis leptorrhynchoides]|uniref:PRA1 family protein B3-like n=1 Tax=Rutidosis leptorrhynchoides TaxID=125765 RepID=UPI003A9A007E
MSSSQTLPILDPPSSSTTGNATWSSAISATPALRAFVARLTDSTRRAFNRRRPWYELIDRTAFSKPESLTDATSRIRKNFNYFRVNYMTLLTAVIAFSLISHPFSLLTIVSLLGAWLFLYLFRPSDQPVVIGGRTFSDREMLGILLLLTIFVVFLTSVGSLLMSAALIGLGIVCVHGAFRDPEDLFLDDQDMAGAGLFSSFSGAATSAAVADVMARV